MNYKTKNGEVCKVVTPWHNEEQKQAFLKAWGESDADSKSYLIMQHDANKEGCAVTKNKGIAKAVEQGANIVVVLDDDCFPTDSVPSLWSLMAQHCDALEPQSVYRYATITDPPSRGTPFNNLTVKYPVAASMGFWTQIGDYCGVRQLAFDCEEMEHRKIPIMGNYFSLSGMNLAFRPKLWGKWATFVDVPRFDDIWMGWMWQREAYRRGYCFNLDAPVVRHARQSNVWKNLRLEAKYLEQSETLWQQIAESESGAYEDLCKLLPHTQN